VAAGIISELSDRLDELSSNWWFLLVIVLIAFLDSVIPIVPSETCVIIGGVAAGLGNYPLWLVIPAGAIGAFAGDNLAYELGQRAGPFFERRAARKQKTRVRLEWTKRQIVERGGPLLITARFIPGGRTLLTLSCGITGQPRFWFARWVGVAAILWASYAALLGFIGGRAFQDDHTKAFLVAFGAAVGVTVAIEVVRWFRHRGDRQPVPPTIVEMADEADHR
jgi:membrane-associated protein